MRAARTQPPSGVAVVALWLMLAFSAFFAGTSRGVFVFGDDVMMYQVTEAIWERGEVSVTSEATRKVVANARRGVDGRRYAKYGLGPSLVALPFYGASHRLFDRLELPQTADHVGNLRAGSTIFGTGLANAATGGATVAVTFLVAVELGFPLLVALLTASCLGASTLLAHYSSTFLSEPLSALCLAVVLLGLLKAKGKGPVKGVCAGGWWLAISGLAAGLAVATKVAHIVVVLPFFFWAAALGWQRSRQRGLVMHSLYWSSFFSTWIGAIAAYNWSRFGSAFETGYGREAGNFSTPLAVGLSGLLASPAKGVLWYCPVLLLSLLGARAFWKRDRACALAVLAASALWLLLISRYYQWFGGGAWGPRFLVPLLPFWILPAAEIFARWRRGSGWRVAIVVARRRQPGRLDDPIAGAVQRSRRVGSLVEARRSRGRDLATSPDRPFCVSLAPLAASRCGDDGEARRAEAPWARPAVRRAARATPTSPSSTTGRTRCSTGRAAASWSRRWRSRWRVVFARRAGRGRAQKALLSSPPQ